MPAGLALETLASIDAVPGAAYDALAAHCAAPAYYDRRFLRAAEQSALLPCEAAHYIVAHRGGEMAAFLPVYRQPVRTADPFGLLARTTSADFAAEDRGLFTHIMHCCDTRLLVRENDPLLYHAIIGELTRLTEAAGAPHFALLNVAEPELLGAAPGLGLETNHMVDRYAIDLSGLDDLDDLMARRMPKDGMYEMRRQRRKFAASDARLVIEEPPFPRLDEVGLLCHETTARNGTPDYLPAAALSRFLATCGDLVRLFSIYSGDRRLSVGIALCDREAMHFWMAGMTYGAGQFSPYAITIAALFEYGFAHGYRRIECGRLNARIKERFGFAARPLYSIINPTPLARQFAPAAARTAGPAPDHLVHHP